VGERGYVDLYHKIDWVISGGETDQGDHMSRPTHPGAFRSLRDQCAAANVPFHHKQNGEWVEVSEAPASGLVHRFPEGVIMHKVGKKSSGRLLDGNTHDEFPSYRIAA
jgi:protein gp37